MINVREAYKEKPFKSNYTPIKINEKRKAFYSSLLSSPWRCLVLEFLVPAHCHSDLRVGPAPHLPQPVSGVLTARGGLPRVPQLLPSVECVSVDVVVLLISVGELFPNREF